ncbi:MAG: hypothetical protein A2Y12_15675 [Planctomycetes bacterium GWF2_42_9]|nr:MAG: hypothetical protein A2Y12_15675 [Planctomycetes bacterium GWF2_42_9]
MSTSDKTRLKPQWLNEIVVMAGNWEPLEHRRRAIANCIDDEKRYLREHSEEMAEKLTKASVNAVIWHYYKGHGPKRESNDMKLSTEFGKLCHAKGIKFGTYINFGSVHIETFFEEHPEFKNLVAIDPTGQPQLYSEYFRCYYRQRPCMSRPEFTDLIIKITLKAIKEGGSEWIHFDNVAQVPCYCDNCKKLFREFLDKKYPTGTDAEKQKVMARFGHLNLNNIELPRGSARLGVDTMPSLHEPVLQEWVDFRCKLLSDAVQKAYQIAKETKPDMVIGANPSFDFGEFTPLVWGTDVERLAISADTLFNEDVSFPRVTDDSRLIGHLFTFKLGRALNVSIPVHQPGATQPQTSPEHTMLSLVEAAIFNRGFLGHVYHAPDLLDGLDVNDSRPTTVKFIKKYSQFFADTQSISEIALLRSHHSLTNQWNRALICKILTEQTLAQYGFQFDVVLESQLDDLSKYKTLVLPNTISIPDAQLAKIRNFIRKGGNVVAIEESMTCNEWGRTRIPADRARLFGDSDLAVGLNGNHCTRKDLVCEILGLNSIETERIFYIPKLFHKITFNNNFANTWVPIIGNSYFQLPTNANDISHLIKASLKDRQMVEIKPSPSFVIPQLVMSKSGQIILHLLNYDVNKSVSTLEIRLHIPNSRKIKTLSSFRLEDQRITELNFTEEPNKISFEINNLNVYQGIIIDTTK